jgi:hypothetical protein
VVHKTFGVELPKDERLSCAVETDEALVLVNLAFRILRLRRIFSAVPNANEATVEDTRVLPLHGASSWLPFSSALPPSNQKCDALKRIPGRRLLTHAGRRQEDQCDENALHPDHHCHEVSRVNL